MGVPTFRQVFILIKRRNITGKFFEPIMLLISLSSTLFIYLDNPCQVLAQQGSGSGEDPRHLPVLVYQELRIQK